MNRHLHHRHEHHPPRRDRSKSQRRRETSSENTDGLHSDIADQTSQIAHKRVDMILTHALKEIHRSRRRDRAPRGLTSSIAKLRRSLQGAVARREENEQEECNLQQQDDDDSVSVTLSISCNSGNSSCFNAQESKENWSNKKYLTLAASACIEDSGEDDSYDTDQAVVCDIDSSSSSSSCSTKEGPILEQQQLHRHEEPIDQQAALHKQVQQAAERLIQEQTIALEAWDEVASEYHRRIEPFTSMFVPHLLDSQLLLTLSEIQSLDDEYLYLKGKSVLDVAAGTGAGALYAASRGASSVMATDFSENMLRQLQSRIICDSRTSHTIDTKVSNGLCLPLSWEMQHDIVFSNFGVIYFPSVKEGLHEMIRCTKQGGKVCLSGWGSKDETHAFSVFPAAMKRCGLDARWYHAQSAARKQMLSMSGIVPISSSEHSGNGNKKCHRRRRKKYHGINLTPNFYCPTTRISSSQFLLHSMMTGAGLDDVRVIPITKYLRLDSATSYWDRFVLASPNLKRFVEHCLSQEDVMKLKDAVSDILHEEHDEESSNPQEAGVVLKASAYIAIGTKTLA